jgi:hypothetical protein
MRVRAANFSHILCSIDPGKRRASGWYLMYQLADTMLASSWQGGVICPFTELPLAKCAHASRCLTAAHGLAAALTHCSCCSCWAASTTQRLKKGASHTLQCLQLLGPAQGSDNLLCALDAVVQNRRLALGPVSDCARRPAHCVIRHRRPQVSMALRSSTRHF